MKGKSCPSSIRFGGPCRLTISRSSPRSPAPCRKRRSGQSSSPSPVARREVEEVVPCYGVDDLHVKLHFVLRAGLGGCDPGAKEKGESEGGVSSGALGEAGFVTDVAANIRPCFSWAWDGRCRGFQAAGRRRQLRIFGINVRPKPKIV
jgi:hypothetical protein